jgi:hypothetical protein
MIMRYILTALGAAAMTPAVAAVVGPLPVLKLLGCAVVAANTAVLGVALLRLQHKPV